MVMDLNKLFIENSGKCELHFTVYDPLDGVEVRMPSKTVRIDPNNHLFKELKRMNVEFEIR
jgi:DNA polymerase-3 subunit alpha